MPKRVANKNGRGSTSQKVLTVKRSRPRAFISGTGGHRSRKSPRIYRPKSESNNTRDSSAWNSDGSSNDAHSVQIPAFYAEAKKSLQIGHHISTVEGQLSKLTISGSVDHNAHVSHHHHHELEKLQAQLDSLKGETQRELEIQQDLLKELMSLNLDNIHYRNTDNI